MNDEIRAALILRYRAAMAEAEANIQVYLRHPAGIGEHSDILEAIEVELKVIAEYDDQIEVLTKYFTR